MAATNWSVLQPRQREKRGLFHHPHIQNPPPPRSLAESDCIRVLDQPIQFRNLVVQFAPWLFVHVETVPWRHRITVPHFENLNSKLETLVSVPRTASTTIMGLIFFNSVRIFQGYLKREHALGSVYVSVTVIDISEGRRADQFKLCFRGRGFECQENLAWGLDHCARNGCPTLTRGC